MASTTSLVFPLVVWPRRVVAPLFVPPSSPRPDASASGLFTDMSGRRSAPRESYLGFPVSTPCISSSETSSSVSPPSPSPSSSDFVPYASHAPPVSTRYSCSAFSTVVIWRTEIGKSEAPFCFPSRLCLVGQSTETSTCEHPFGTSTSIAGPWLHSTTASPGSTVTNLNSNFVPMGTTRTHSHVTTSSFPRRIGATLLLSHFPRTPPVPSPINPTLKSPGQSRFTRTVTAASTRSSGDKRGLRLARLPRRADLAWYASGVTTGLAVQDGVAFLSCVRPLRSPRVEDTETDHPLG
mmetsp:Transcript_12351/g.46054  ORF Transcript_12351/g.46054 Transcript_12351/m.46054 type:complete len:294 (-) Transcript_12351:197-1078(-)